MQPLQSEPCKRAGTHETMAWLKSAAQHGALRYISLKPVLGCLYLLQLKGSWLGLHVQLQVEAFARRGGALTQRQHDHDCSAAVPEAFRMVVITPDLTK